MYIYIYIYIFKYKLFVYMYISPSHSLTPSLSVSGANPKLPDEDKAGIMYLYVRQADAELLGASGET